MMKIVIWSAGEITNQMLKYPLKAGCSIEFICDNNPQKWEGQINGIKIHSPEKIKMSEWDIIIVGSKKYAYEIVEQLKNMGVQHDKISMCAIGIDGWEYYSGEWDNFFEIKKKEFIPFKKGPAPIYQTYIGETYRSRERRIREKFFETYCNGEGLDIGYGADPITPDCSGWELRNGDAQYLDGVEDESFDFVYSSHCLEHMVDVRVALKNWFRVVKKGGFLIIAIPHRDLYEKKKTLPSRWNPDHKHMFLIGKAEYPDTLDIIEEVKKSLENYDIKYVKACDEGHTIVDPLIHSDGEYQIELVIQKIDSRKECD